VLLLRILVLLALLILVRVFLACFHPLAILRGGLLLSALLTFVLGLLVVLVVVSVVLVAIIHVRDSSFR